MSSIVGSVLPICFYDPYPIIVYTVSILQISDVDALSPGNQFPAIKSALIRLTKNNTERKINVCAWESGVFKLLFVRLHAAVFLARIQQFPIWED